MLTSLIYVGCSVAMMTDVLNEFPESSQPVHRKAGRCRRANTQYARKFGKRRFTQGLIAEYFRDMG